MRKTRSLRSEEVILPYLLISPALVIILGLLVFPIFQGIRLSLFQLKGLQLSSAKFVGLGNFERLFTNAEFWNALKVTLFYTLLCLALTLLVGLGTALLLNQQFKGQGLARVIMTLPWAIPEVATSLIWIWMLNPDVGIVNFLLKNLNLISQNIRWLNQVEWAFPTIVFVTIWKTFPFFTVVFLTALQSVNKELYEVAKIDGANEFQLFRFITIPGIRPTLNLMALLITIWSLKRFTLIWIMTAGGPVGLTETLGILIYRNAFKFLDLGYASSIGVVGFVISLIVTFLYFFVEKQSLKQV